MQHHRDGFTLIELSIVLVIIGLIVGGVLVGRDLIKASEVRAQISQIEKYNQAVNTFRGKYGYLPGDIPDPDASKFGFHSRGGSEGTGDGNGLLETGESWGDCGTSHIGSDAFSGELGTFWVDLSTARLIDGSFSSVIPTSDYEGLNITGTLINAYLPQAKIGNGNYVYVWSGGWQEMPGGEAQSPGDNKNYFGLSAVVANSECYVPSNTSITVAQAYAIDKKMDDGLPQSGNVMAMYANYSLWAAGGAPNSYGENNSGDFSTVGNWGSATRFGPVTSTSDILTPAATVNSCYDGSKGLPEQYSITYQSGSQPNCALSFKFQ